MKWLDDVAWDERGLVPVIVQEAITGEVLMFAWMNRECLAETVATREAVYFSRSRSRRWKKGEESGHIQRVVEVRIDCDSDVVLLKVEQVGGIACHTGRHSCFFSELQNDAQASAAEASRWVVVAPVLKDPQEIYRK